MKFVKFAAVAAFGLAGVFTGCTTNDSGDETVAAAPADVQSFALAGCNSDVDAASGIKLNAAKEDLVEFFQELMDGNLDNAQYISRNLKATYGQALSSNPGNCEAQLGYALSSIADLVNDSKLNALVDTLEGRGMVELNSNGNLYRISNDDASKVIVGTGVLAKSSSGSVISDVQDAIAGRLLPVTDSAITYLTNVVRSGNVTVQYTDENRTYELDNGEFAPALGALYLLRAIMVTVASYDLEVSQNGSYAWVDSLTNLNLSNYKTNPGVKHALSLLDRNNPFGTVKSDWVNTYKNIPSMLDSAISYVQLGLQYGIDEAANGMATQMNDIYVVGDGEDADVSVADMKRAIDSLEHYKGYLYQDKEFSIGGKTVVMNLGKVFNITNIKQYWPYYKLVDPADWYKEMGSDYWSTEISWDSYSHEELEGLLKGQLVLRGDEEYVDVDFDNDYYDVNLHEYVDSPVLDFEIEYDGGYVYGAFLVVMQGCKASFVLQSLNRYSYAYGRLDGETSTFAGLGGVDVGVPDTIVVSGKSVSLASEFCKVENGVTMFRNAVRSTVPNLFVLTDAQGNETLSLKKIVDGVPEMRFGELEYRGYTMAELKDYFVFPDVTYGGLFPNMTKDELWDWLYNENDDVYENPVSAVTETGSGTHIDW